MIPPKMQGFNRPCTFCATHSAHYTNRPSVNVQAHPPAWPDANSVTLKHGHITQKLITKKQAKNILGDNRLLTTVLGQEKTKETI